MSIIERVRDFLRPYDMNQRMLTPAQVWARGGIWRPISGAGLDVTAEMAMQAAVGACVRLLADDISGLPVDVYRKVGDETVVSNRPAWLEYPTGRRWDTFQSYVSDVVVSLLTDGNAFVECAPDTFSPRLFKVHDPETITVKLEEGGIVYVGPNGARFTEANMMHIPWIRLPGKLRGLSVLAASNESTGLEVAARQWASAFFANGGTLGMLIKHPGTPTPAEIELMRETFNARHQGSDKAFRLGIVTGGADVQDASIAPANAALEPLWKHVLEEAARLYHVPPHLLGSQDPGGSSFASVEHRSIEYVQHAVVPVTTRIESAHSRFLGRDRYIKLNVNALMRGDVATRTAWYTFAVQNKVMRPAEVRAKEDLPVDPENQGYLETPNNNAGSDEAAPAEEQEEPRDIIVAPELRIDSVEVSEAGVTRIAQAATDGLATGVALVREDVGASRDALRAAFTERIAALEAKQDETTRQIAELAERERIRSLPVSIRVHGDTVYETRGDETVQKKVYRDPETGKVIGLVAA